MTSLIRGAKLDKTARLLDPVLRSAVVDALDTEPLYTDSAVNELLDTPPLESPTYPESAEISSTTAVSESTEWMKSENLSQEAASNTAPPTFRSYAEYQEQLGEELSRLRAEAVEQGYAEGVLAGHKKAEQEAAQVREKLTALVEGMRIAFERDLDGLAEIGAEIAFEAVTRIIGRSYLDHEGITAVVREVISHAKDRSRLVIRVSPADYHELIETRESLTENGNSRSIEILADDRVELGGCLLETPAGNLDGRLEVQLQQLRDTLLNARLRRSEPVLQQ